MRAARRARRIERDTPLAHEQTRAPVPRTSRRARPSDPARPHSTIHSRPARRGKSWWRGGGRCPQVIPERKHVRLSKRRAAARTWSSSQLRVDHMRTVLSDAVVASDCASGEITTCASRVTYPSRVRTTMRNRREDEGRVRGGGVRVRGGGVRVRGRAERSGSTRGPSPLFRRRTTMAYDVCTASRRCCQGEMAGLDHQDRWSL